LNNHKLYFIRKLRKIDFEDDPLHNPSPRKSINTSPTNKILQRSSVFEKRSSISPLLAKRGSIRSDLALKISNFEQKSIMPYTEEREILILPSFYAVQFEKSGLHERVFPLALQKENEIKMKYLSKIK